MGYQRNEYDLCVMNKIVNSKQCTILWHDDYLKMLHFDSGIFLAILLTLMQNIVFFENDHHTGYNTQIPQDDH